MKKHTRHEKGEVSLEPMVEIPSREAWLYENPQALASVLEGIQQAKEGRISKLNIDFSQYKNARPLKGRA